MAARCLSCPTAREPASTGYKLISTRSGRRRQCPSEGKKGCRGTAQGWFTKTACCTPTRLACRKLQSLPAVPQLCARSTHAGAQQSAVPRAPSTAVKRQNRAASRSKLSLPRDAKKGAKRMKALGAMKERQEHEPAAWKAPDAGPGSAGPRVPPPAGFAGQKGGRGLHSPTQT